MDQPQLSLNEFRMGGALVGAESMVQQQSVVPGQLQVAPKGFFWGMASYNYGSHVSTN
jgi:hypothetical protein